MSLSIGASLAPTTWVIESEATSQILYNGHAGLGASMVGSRADVAVDGRSTTTFRPADDDEVLVAFDQGELRHPVAVAPLWDSNCRPPSDKAASTNTDSAARHPHLGETPLRRGT